MSIRTIPMPPRGSAPQSLSPYTNTPVNTVGTGHGLSPCTGSSLSLSPTLFPGESYADPANKTPRKQHDGFENEALDVRYSGHTSEDWSRAYWILKAALRKTSRSEGLDTNSRFRSDKAEKPQSLTVEVKDAAGGWQEGASTPGTATAGRDRSPTLSVDYRNTGQKHDVPEPPTVYLGADQR